MKQTELNNRQAYFNFHIEDKYEAGIVLLGTEVKSIREGKVSFNDSFCMFDKGELWVRGLFINTYTHGNKNNHIEVHDRKLLLNKRELEKLEGKVKEKGFSIIPLRIFLMKNVMPKWKLVWPKVKRNLTNEKPSRIEMLTRK